MPELIGWNLRDIMAARKIRNKQLADILNRPPESISRLKTRNTLPAIGAEEINALVQAINELSEQHYGKCTAKDLLHLGE